MTLPSLITCWYVGNKEDKIVPFRFLKTTDLAGEKKKNKKVISNMKQLMKLVATCGEGEGIRVSERRKADWNVEATLDLYSAVKKYFEYSENLRIRRHKQLAWKTVLNHYLRKGKRFANEQ